MYLLIYKQMNALTMSGNKIEVVDTQNKEELLRVIAVLDSTLVNGTFKGGKEVL